MNTTTYITQVTVMDPVTNLPVAVEIHRDNVSGAMFGIDATFAEQVKDDVISPYNGETVHLAHPDELAPDHPVTTPEPFTTAYVFGKDDSWAAHNGKWKRMENDPTLFTFATQEALDAFISGVEAAEGWIEVHQLNDAEQRACKKARG